MWRKLPASRPLFFAVFGGNSVPLRVLVVNSSLLIRRIRVIRGCCLSLLNGYITWHGRPGRVLWTTFLTGETPVPRDWGGGLLYPGLYFGWPFRPADTGVWLNIYGHGLTLSDWFSFRKRSLTPPSLKTRKHRPMARSERHDGACLLLWPAFQAGGREEPPLQSKCRLAGAPRWRFEAVIFSILMAVTHKIWGASLEDDHNLSWWAQPTLQKIIAASGLYEIVGTALPYGPAFILHPSSSDAGGTGFHCR